MTEKRNEFLKELGNPYQRETQEADRVFAIMQRSGATRSKLAIAEKKYNEAVAENEEAKRLAKEKREENVDPTQVAFAAMENSVRLREKLARAEQEYRLAQEENEQAKRDIR